MRYEIAEYLVNLHTLMEAQRTIGRESSTWLLKEYELTWSEFKDTVKQEREDEARPSNSKRSVGPEKGTHLSHSQPERSLTDRLSPIGKA